MVIIIHRGENPFTSLLPRLCVVVAEPAVSGISFLSLRLLYRRSLPLDAGLMPICIDCPVIFKETVSVSDRSKTQLL